MSDDQNYDDSQSNTDDGWQHMLDEHFHLLRTFPYNGDQ
jgi:hypothetical protein